MKHELSQLTQLSPHIDYASILYAYEKEAVYLDQVLDALNICFEGHTRLVLMDTKTHYQAILAKLRGALKSEQLSFLQFLDILNNFELKDNIQSERSLQHLKKQLEILYNRFGCFSLWIGVPPIDEERVFDLCTLNTNEKTRKYIHHWSVFAFQANDFSASSQNRLKQYNKFFMTDDNFVRSSLYYQSQRYKPLFHVPAVAAQKNVKKAQSHLESLIMRQPDPILILDKEDRVLLPNDAYTQFFQWTKEDVIGRSNSELSFVPEDRKFEILRDRSFIRLGESVQSYETQRLKKDGTLVDVLSSSFPLLDGQHQIKGRAVILRDNTAAKQTMNLLLQTEKLSVVGELAEGVARELLQPITSIKDFAQLLEKTNQEDKNYFFVIRSEVDRIEKILGELLSLSQPKYSFFQPENVISLLQGIILLLKPQAQLNNVRIVFDYYTEIAYIDCDKNQLKQAFINYIKNAIEAMPRGGTLRVEVQWMTDKRIAIIFSDQGVGIPEEILVKIGHPFFTTKENGTGLGFMVSGKMIESHKGSVTISSIENKGTTVKIILPLLS
ncbi:MAG: ATP-binding protein [Sporolactobacillus sp.]